MSAAENAQRPTLNFQRPMPDHFFDLEITENRSEATEHWLTVAIARNSVRSVRLRVLCDSNSE